MCFFFIVVCFSYYDATNAELFMSEQADLLNDLQNLPRNSAVRKGDFKFCLFFFRFQIFFFRQ